MYHKQIKSSAFQFFTRHCPTVLNMCKYILKMYLLKKVFNKTNWKIYCNLVYIFLFHCLRNSLLSAACCQLLNNFYGIALERWCENWRISGYELTSSLESSEKQPQRSMCLKERPSLPQGLPYCVGFFWAFFGFLSLVDGTWTFPHRASAFTSVQHRKE